MPHKRFYALLIVLFELFDLTLQLFPLILEVALHLILILSHLIQSTIETYVSLCELEYVSLLSRKCDL